VKLFWFFVLVFLLVLDPLDDEDEDEPGKASLGGSPR
jgi:hypothetical protein